MYWEKKLAFRTQGCGLILRISLYQRMIPMTFDTLSLSHHISRFDCLQKTSRMHESQLFLHHFKMRHNFTKEHHSDTTNTTSFEALKCENLLTASARGLGASAKSSCGTGTANASEHSAMAIKARHFHVCILVSIWLSVRKWKMWTTMAN